MRSRCRCILRWRPRCCIWPPEDPTGSIHQKRTAAYKCEYAHLYAAVLFSLFYCFIFLINLPTVFTGILRQGFSRTPRVLVAPRRVAKRLPLCAMKNKKSFLRHPALPPRRVPPHAPPSHSGHSNRHSHRRTSHKDPDSPSYTRTHRTLRSPYGLPSRRPSGNV